MILTNIHFKKAHEIDPAISIFFSQRLKQHYICVRTPKNGYVLEDGTFISYERLTQDLGDLKKNKFLELYVVGTNIFENVDKI